MRIEALEEEIFQEHSNRIELLRKEEASADSLISSIKEFNEEFAYSFGAEIRSKSNQAVESFLIALGRYGIREAFDILNSE